MTLWRNLRRRLQGDKDLDDELRSHLAMDIGERIDRGQSRIEAGRQARLTFGNELLIREVTRDMWGWGVLDAVRRDIHYAVRQIGRSPGFTAISLLSLALGLGATVAMFSIVNGVLLKPLGFREPETLYLARSLPP